MGWDLLASGVVQATPDKLHSSYSVMGKQRSGLRRSALIKKSDKKKKIQNCTYFSKNKKIRKKVLTFADGGVIITKLSARADAKEFL